MITEASLVELIKVKLEEISPFEEPTNFIAAAADPAYDKVKAVVAYIKQEIKPAIHYCLNNLPLTLLAKDIHADTKDIKIEQNGLGYIENMPEYYRYIRCSVPSHWKRDVIAFITSANPLYLLQQNKYTRGGICKPVVAIVPESKRLELYSFPDVSQTASAYPITESGAAVINYINPDVTLSSGNYDVSSDISDFIALRCAQQVYEIFGMEQAKIMQGEMIAKLEQVTK